MLMINLILILLLGGLLAMLSSATAVMYREWLPWPWCCSI